MSVDLKVLDKDVQPYRKEHFSLIQASLILILTLVITIGIGYYVGQKFFWTDLDVKRLNNQLTYLQQKVNNEPKNLAHRVDLGYTYFLLGKNSKAIKELNQVLEFDKNYFSAYYNLGLIYNDEDRLDDALEVIQKAVEISPRDFKGYVQKGIVYRKMKMYKESLEALEQANRLMPGRSDIIYQIGLVAEAKGDKKEAIEIFKDALKYDPLNKEAAKALERVQ